MGFPGDSAVKNLSVKQETWVPSLGREHTPGGRSGNPLQYSCQRNPLVEEHGRLLPLGVTKGSDTTELLKKICLCVYIYIFSYTYVCVFIHTYICLENPMDRGCWWIAVHGVSKSRTQLKQLSTYIHTKHLLCVRHSSWHLGPIGEKVTKLSGSLYCRGAERPWKLHVINKQIVFKDDQCYDKRKEEEDEEEQRAGRREQVNFYMRVEESGRVSLWKWCLVAKSCPTLCGPMDCSQPGSPVQGISKTRMLEWVAISFSRHGAHISCISRHILYCWAPREAGFQQRLEGCQSMSMRIFGRRTSQAEETVRTENLKLLCTLVLKEQVDGEPGAEDSRE